MSIHLLCGETFFTCNINYWNTIRESISKATNLYIIDYLNKLYDNDNDNDNDDNSENDLHNLDNERNSTYNNSINRTLLREKLESFVKDIHYIEHITHPYSVGEVEYVLLIEFLKLYTYYLDLFTLVGVAGAFSLINKGDNEGFYSVGNSIDIVDTISSVISFIEDEYIKASIQECLFVFKSSVQNHFIVVINYTPYEEPKQQEVKQLRHSFVNVNTNILNLKKQQRRRKTILHL